MQLGMLWFKLIHASKGWYLKVAHQGKIDAIRGVHLFQGAKIILALWSLYY